jgi:hypothetical protein
MEGPSSKFETCLLNIPSVSKYLSLLTFFYNFDHSSYSKNCASTIYFVCYMFYCCMYFKLDLSFYMFAIIFLNETNDQSCKKKVNNDKYFHTEEYIDVLIKL